MTYTDSQWKTAIWWLVYPSNRPPRWDTHLVLPDSGLEGLLADPLNYRDCPPLQYGIAADYIEDNWDRLLSVAQTAEGVDPEPLLRRLVERLRVAFAEGQQ